MAGAVTGGDQLGNSLAQPVSSSMSVASSRSGRLGILCGRMGNLRLSREAALFFQADLVDRECHRIGLLAALGRLLGLKPFDLTVCAPAVSNPPRGETAHCDGQCCSGPPGYFTRSAG
ncbi:hypothetical protein CURE108131_11050 [Cupriavidus respiraculi]